jgi:hypothetical protein
MSSKIKPTEFAEPLPADGMDDAGCPQCYIKFYAKVDSMFAGLQLILPAMILLQKEK